MPPAFMQCSQQCDHLAIEGLHDAVCTYMRTILPPLLGFLFVWHGMEKNNQSAVTFD